MTDPAPPATLTLVVITLNEEANIGRCLESVSGLARQMVVVDSGSSDRTREIAEAAGAEVWTREFAGYGAQKQFAFEKAQSDWVLCLDADEWLDDEARRSIGQILQSTHEGTIAGFRLRMSTLYLGRWCRYAGWLREWKLRLVRRDRAAWTNDVIHERLDVTGGRIAKLGGRILHEPYHDLGDQRRKIDRYTDIIAVRDRGTPLPRIVFGVTVEPPLVFLQKYFLQLGFLDGAQGFVGAGMMAVYFFLRYAKIWHQRTISPSS